MGAELQDRVVLITGGSKGIGYALAEKCLAAGASVAIAARDQVALDRAAKELSAQGGRVLPISIDIRDDASVTAGVEAVVGTLGDINVLVNNAGAALPVPFDDLTGGAWLEALNYKLVGYGRCVHAVLPSMRRTDYGRIINVAGTAGREPNPWSTTTGAVNAALLNYTKTLSRAVAAEGILVNSVSPGPIATDRWRNLATNDEASAQQLISQIPVGRLGEPHEVASAILFLASPQASFITGTTLNVDGGRAASVVF